VEHVELSEASVADLLAMIVRAAAPFSALLEKAGGLEALARSDPFEIAAHLEGRDLDAMSENASRARAHRTTLEKARALAAAFELGRRIEIARTEPVTKLTSASIVAAWATPRLATLTHEELWMLALDGRGHLRVARCIAKGGLHGAAVQAAHPIRAAPRADASAFVLVHNHPSGDPTPSKEDIALTAQVGAAGDIAGVPLLDHIVVARAGYACVPWHPPTDRDPDDSAR
jgi:DNA repair protein RadC